MKRTIKYYRIIWLRYDLPAGLSVFLVALPLCLGIALASGAPLYAGLLSGIVGVFQLLLGILKLGVIANYFPSSVIKGMLAAIGMILIFKQIPLALGYD